MSEPTARSTIGDSLVTRLRATRRARRTQAVTGTQSTRELFVIAFAVPIALILLLGLLTVITLLAAGDSFTGMVSTVFAMWLVVHHVPISVNELAIGVLPLMPTMVLVVAVAAVIGRVATPGRTRAELISLVLAALGGPLVITALGLAVVMDASTALPVQAPDPLTAFCWTAGVHGVGVGLGLGRGRWAQVGGVLGITWWGRQAVRTGLAGVLGLFVAAALMVAVRLVVNFDVTGELIRAGHTWSGMLGLVVLSVLYLPNVIIGAAGFLVGADVHVGTAAGDIVSSHGGSLPGLPVLAVLPDGGAGHWMAVLFVVPAVVAVVVGRRSLDIDPVRNAQRVAVAAAITATVMVVATALAGGDLGALGSAGINVPAAGVFAFGWIAVVGMVMALLVGCLPASLRERLTPAHPYVVTESGSDDRDDFVTADHHGADREGGDDVRTVEDDDTVEIPDRADAIDVETPGEGEDLIAADDFGNRRH
ncbi:cell division protein PerM [Williamsia sterculiae]|uniref:Uncharacterized protein n=1 Tax=Williamsia sterculiae TaxID=1344003 RepID=A0A1N7DIL6_9NOCA|nr:DUF6350 family protein [Williamsia sterculiae]SIR75699.1 hypothetical protein SAMN05445060_0666 [Williamsia sterculiae]